eukprot:360311-Chlamydomonas_euryale.AAC.4
MCEAAGACLCVGCQTLRAAAPACRGHARRGGVCGGEWCGRDDRGRSCRATALPAAVNETSTAASAAMQLDYIGRRVRVRVRVTGSADPAKGMPVLSVARQRGSTLLIQQRLGAVKKRHAIVHGPEAP